MYNIPYFKAGNDTDVIDFIQAHPFILLCGVDKDGCPVATQVPVLIDEKEGKIHLSGHLMRKQDHTNAFINNPNVLAIFAGENYYVSATLYKTKNVASTWNYKSVHVKGQITFMDDEGLYLLLVKLTNHFEGTENSPASVKNMTPEYVRDNMKAIIGFEIEVTDLQHVFKESQNRDDETKDNIKKHRDSITQIP